MGSYNPSMRLIRFNKPFRVLSQFTDPDDRPTLAGFIDSPDLYPAGRLDFESEGLMLLTNDGRLQARISDPHFKLAKTYLVQVEGEPGQSDLAPLRSGVHIKGDLCCAESVCCITAPDFLWLRKPPIRERKSIPTSWIEIVLTQGRNRQVRRMTAAIGYPTLRLIRTGIGIWRVDDLQSGEWQPIAENDIRF